MKNYLFKSNDLQEILQQLEMLLAEQRHQRADLATIKRTLNKFINDSNLQKQVDEYYDHELEDK